MPLTPVIPAAGEAPVMVEGPQQPIPGELHPGNDPTLWDPVVVEVTQLYGEPEVVDWLGPAIKVEHPINALPTAKLPVVLHDRFTVNVGSEETPDARAIENVLPNDAVVTIRTARPEPETDFTLFRGYRELIGRTGRRHVSSSIDCIHIADDLAQDPERAIHGQLWLSKADEVIFAADPQAAVLPKILTGWPAVFNPNGAGNCRHNLVWMVDPEAQDVETWHPGGDGWPLKFGVPLWTHRFDPTRMSWSWARVFMFLFYWGRRNLDRTLGMLKHDLVDCNLWRIINYNDYHLIDPDSQSGSAGDPWGRILLGKPVSLALEGMDWIQALQWCCHRAGLLWFIDTWTDDETGEVHEGFRFSLPEGGRRTRFKMPSKHYETHDKDWAAVRQAADVSNLQIVSSVKGCTNYAIGAGGAKEYEVTVELVPGWNYDANLSPQVDVDPNDEEAVQAAIAAMGTLSWATKFNRTGALFDQYWQVLRLWIAPDYADMSESAKVRPHAPWTADKYEALDFADLEIGEVQSGPIFMPNKNAVRPRPMKRCLTGPFVGQTYAPRIQVNYNSGSGSWFQVAAGVTVLNSRLGVFFEIDDLRMAIDEVHAKSLAQAYIEGTLRVRITGVITADLEFWPQAYCTSPGSLSERNRGKLLYRPGAFKHAVRDTHGGYSGGNSIYADGPWPVNEQRLDDYGMLVERYVAANDRIRHAGPVEVQGLRFWDSQFRYWQPGDEVEGVMAEDNYHNLDLPLRTKDDDGYAIVANLTWTYDPGDGKKKAPFARTTLTLESPAALVSFGK